MKKKSIKKTVQKIAAFSLSGLIFLSAIFLPRVLMAQTNGGGLLDGSTQPNATNGGLPDGTGNSSSNCNTSSNTSSNSSNGTSLTLQNPICANSISQLLTDLLQVVIQIGAVVATLMFIYAGFVYLTAQGSESDLEKAHKIFKNTAIGTGILLGAQTIVLILQGTINNVSGTNIFGGTGN